MTDKPVVPLNYIEVDLDAIAHNVRRIKDHIGLTVDLMAVVKANGYGHGALAVAQTVLRHGATYLAVARTAEGEALRKAGVSAPILVMGYTPPGETITAIMHELTLTVTDWLVAQALSQQASALGRQAVVHLKVDTGMGRFGLLPAETLPFIEQVSALPGLEVGGLFSHFAMADSVDKSYTWQQFQIFQHIRVQLETAGHHLPLCHIANSAATLDLPAMHLDAVRVGIALYGLRPSSEVDPVFPLKPALALKSQIAQVYTVPAGTSISYGRTYITPRAMTVALVPIGYGDGYHRLLSNRGAVLINGHRAPIIGRVCMDQFVVDVSECGPVALNAEVVVLGRQENASITAEDVAVWSETINYEVTTALLPRVPRRYRTTESLTGTIHHAVPPVKPP